MTRWSVYVLIAIGFAIACAFLSHWQFDRNESRSEQIALVEKNYDAEPVPLADLIGDDGTLAIDESLDGRSISGVWVGAMAPGGCGREFRGTWRDATDESTHPFVLTKKEGSGK